MKKIILLFASLFIFGMSQLAAQTYVDFTLRNTTAKSIPLKIPGVMNPNLSPFSNSGVGLKIGQKIFFTNKGKKTLLLSVTEDLADQTLDVAKLIRERKKDIFTQKN